MRIAIFSDVHGNWNAFRGVLEDIKKKQVDDIYFLGDLCTLGPNPVETAELLFESKVKSILGNHDEYLFNESAIYQYTNERLIIDSIFWCRDKINSDIITKIQEFPRTLELMISLKNSILFFHGSPKSNTDIILAESEVEKINQYFSGYNNSIFIGGHTHIQMHKRYFNKMILNPGSVGQPFQANIDKGPPILLPYAEYLLLSINENGNSIEYFQIEYDLDDYIRQLKSSSLPLKGWLLGQYQSIQK